MSKLSRMMLASVLTAPLIAHQAHATFVTDITQDGANVDVVGAGSLNLAALSLTGSYTSTGIILPRLAILVSKGGGHTYGNITGPTSFGTGQNPEDANASLGDSVGVFGSENDLFIESNYISGAPLSFTMTYDNATIASLGLTSGAYTWTWGTGATADSFILDIGQTVAAVPEPASLLLLAVPAGLLLLRKPQQV